MKANLGWFLALLFVVGAIGWIFQPLASPRPFEYDDADYVYAGTQGLAASYWDRNSMSLREFVEKGLELRRDPERRGDMSQYVRAAGDLSFYRHYHGPVYAYWIGWMQALGVHSEAGYRASGLILHSAGAIAVFWLFLAAFPGLPPAGAFTAALAFAMNRTTLLTALNVTQHVAYIFVCVLALFALARYLATSDRRFWYLTAGLAGLAFATVELAVVLIGAIVLSVVLAERHLGWRHLLGLLPSGAGWFLGVVAVVWPKGVFELNALKGYLYLAYIAVSRKTFNPIGPMQMWGDKLRNYPLEFIVPIVAIVGIIVYSRRSRSALLNPAILPFLVYAGLFAAVTLVVTVPYAHYHGSMMAAASVIVGASTGAIWARLRQPAGLAALAAVVVTLTLLDRSYVGELRVLHDAQPSQTANVLHHVEQAAALPMVIPYYFVPSLHYYRPEIQTVGYDVDWTIERLTQAALATDQSEVLCNPSVCDQLVASLPPESVEAREVVGRAAAAEEPLDALRLRRR